MEENENKKIKRKKKNIYTKEGENFGFNTKEYSIGTIKTNKGHSTSIGQSKKKENCEGDFEENNYTAEMGPDKHAIMNNTDILHGHNNDKTFLICEKEASKLKPSNKMKSQKTQSRYNKEFYALQRKIHILNQSERDNESKTPFQSINPILDIRTPTMNHSLVDNTKDKKIDISSCLNNDLESIKQSNSDTGISCTLNQYETYESNTKTIPRIVKHIHSRNSPGFSQKILACESLNPPSDKCKESNSENTLLLDKFKSSNHLNALESNEIIETYDTSKDFFASIGLEKSDLDLQRIYEIKKDLPKESSKLLVFETELNDFYPVLDFFESIDKRTSLVLYTRDGINITENIKNSEAEFSEKGTLADSSVSLSRETKPVPLTFNTKIIGKDDGLHRYLDDCGVSKFKVLSAQEITNKSLGMKNEEKQPSMKFPVPFEGFRASKCKNICTNPNNSTSVDILPSEQNEGFKGSKANDKFRHPKSKEPLYCVNELQRQFEKSKPSITDRAVNDNVFATKSGFDSDNRLKIHKKSASLYEGSEVRDEYAVSMKKLRGNVEYYSHDFNIPDNDEICNVEKRGILENSKNSTITKDVVKSLPCFVDKKNGSKKDPQYIKTINEEADFDCEKKFLHKHNNISEKVYCSSMPKEEIECPQIYTAGIWGEDFKSFASKDEKIDPGIVFKGEKGVKSLKFLSTKQDIVSDVVETALEERDSIVNIQRIKNLVNDKRYLLFIKKTKPSLFKNCVDTKEFIIKQENYLNTRALVNSAGAVEPCKSSFPNVEVLQCLEPIKECTWTDTELKLFNSLIIKYRNRFNSYMVHFPDKTISDIILRYYLSKNKTYAHIKKRPGRISDSEVRMIVENEWTENEIKNFSENFKILGKNLLKYQSWINKTEKDLRIFLRYYIKYIEIKEPKLSKPKQAKKNVLSKEEVLSDWSIDERLIFAVYYPYFNKNWSALSAYFPKKKSGDLKLYYSKYFKFLNINEQKLESSLQNIETKFRSDPVKHIGSKDVFDELSYSCGILFKK